MAGSISAVISDTCIFLLTLERFLWNLLFYVATGLALYRWYSVLYWFKIEEDGILSASDLLEQVKNDKSLESMDDISQDTLIGSTELKHISVHPTVHEAPDVSRTTSLAIYPATSDKSLSYSTSFALEISVLLTKEDKPLSSEISSLEEETISHVEPSFSFLIAHSESKQSFNNLSFDISAILEDVCEDASICDARCSTEASKELTKDLVSYLHSENSRAVEEDSLDIQKVLSKYPSDADSLLNSSLLSLPEVSFYGDELSHGLEFTSKKVSPIEKKTDIGNVAAAVQRSDSMVCIPDLSLLVSGSSDVIEGDSLDIKDVLSKFLGAAESLLTSSLPSLPEISFYGDELSRTVELPPKRMSDPEAPVQRFPVAPVQCSDSMECIPDLSLNHADLDVSHYEFSFAVFGASIDLPASATVDNEGDSIDINKIIADFNGSSSSSTPTSLLDVSFPSTPFQKSVPGRKISSKKAIASFTMDSEGDSVDINKILADFNGAASSSVPTSLLDVSFPSVPSIKSIPRKVSSKKAVASHCFVSTSRKALATVSNIPGLGRPAAIASSSTAKKTPSVKSKGKENVPSRLPRASAIPKRVR